MTTIMKEEPKPVQILIVDDDADDRLLIREAFDENDLPCRLEFVANGEGMVRLLKNRLAGSDTDSPEIPNLILLDLNMPRMDGREALQWIKSQARLKHIPIVVLTTSDAYEDVRTAYELGSSSFVVKPSSFDELVSTVSAIWNYWCGIVRFSDSKPDYAMTGNASADGNERINE